MCDPPDCDESKGQTFICDVLEYDSIRDFEQNPIWEVISMKPGFGRISAQDIGNKFKGREVTTLEMNVIVEIEIIGKKRKRPGYGIRGKLLCQWCP